MAPSDERAHPRRRQLRQLRLQPGPVPVPARRRVRGAAQRRGATRARPGRLRRRPALPRPRHARGGRRLRRDGAPLRRDRRCRSSASVWACSRWRWRTAESWTGRPSCCTARPRRWARGRRRLRRTADALHRDPLPLAGRRSRRTVPDELEVTAWTDDGIIMGLRHRELPVEGVQFHPESVLTEHGHRMLANWLAECGDHGCGRPVGAGSPRWWAGPRRDRAAPRAPADGPMSYEDPGSSKPSRSSGRLPERPAARPPVGGQTPGQEPSAEPAPGPGPGAGARAPSRSTAVPGTRRTAREPPAAPWSRAARGDEPAARRRGPTARGAGDGTGARAARRRRGADRAMPVVAEPDAGLGAPGPRPHRRPHRRPAPRTAAGPPAGPRGRAWRPRAGG